MKRFFLSIILISMLVCPKYSYCQGIYGVYGIHDAMDKPSQHYGSIKKWGSEASKNKGERMSWREKEEARKYEERRKKLKNMSGTNLLWYFDDSDYTSIILSDSELKSRVIDALSSSRDILNHFKNDGLKELIIGNPSLEAKVREEILGKKEKILDFAQNPDLYRIIMSNPSLRDYYEKMKAKQDIKHNPRKVLEGIQDPKLRQIIKEDPELVRILAQEIEKKAQEDRELQERLDADEKAEQNRKKREREKETTRIVDENNRASEQTKENKIEQTKNKNLQDELKSSPIFVQLPDVSSLNTTIQDPDALKVKPIDIFGINYTDDLSTKGDDKLKKANLGNKTTNDDDNLYDQSYLEQKWDGIKYDAKDNVYKINKQFEISKKEFSTRIKKIPDNARRKVEAVPITWVENKTKNIVNFAYPGAEMYETSKVQIKSGKEQVKLFEGILSCISDAVDAGVSGKFDIFECIKPSVKIFTDEQLSNTESLTHMKIRRYIPFLKKSKINENEE